MLKPSPSAVQMAVKATGRMIKQDNGGLVIPIYHNLFDYFDKDGQHSRYYKTKGAVSFKHVSGAVLSNEVLGSIKTTSEQPRSISAYV